jgi:hypothetical protein
MLYSDHAHSAYVYSPQPENRTVPLIGSIIRVYRGVFGLLGDFGYDSGFEQILHAGKLAAFGFAGVIVAVLAMAARAASWDGVSGIPGGFVRSLYPSTHRTQPSATAWAVLGCPR